MAEHTEVETSYIFADSDPGKPSEAARLMDEFALRVVKDLGVALLGGTIKIRTMGPQP